MSDGFDGLMLLKDKEGDNSEHENYVDALKTEFINSELKNLSEEDIAPDIRLIANNIPKNASLLEKIRWVYINLGKVFCYDYRVAYDMDYAYNKNTELNRSIERYQTCIQVSDILCKVLRKIPGVTANIIERSAAGIRGHSGENHIAVCVEFKEDEFSPPYKLLLDLTLDLLNIHADCQTKHFAFTDDGSGTYDIISQFENTEMDKKLGFITDKEDYRDYRIAAADTKLKEKDLKGSTPQEIIDYKLSVINSLCPKFSGYHEGKMYIGMLLSKLLNTKYHEYNLYYQKDGRINLKTVYKIELDGYEKWVVYSNRLGLISTDKSNLRRMLNDEWKTNSKTLRSIVDSIEEKEEKVSDVIIKK